MGTWTCQACEEYIEWCHISKLFPRSRYTVHRKTDKANLHHCRNPAFLERCIQVYQHLYRLPRVNRNEINLSIARMVYAEEILGKVVDWRTLKCSGSNMITPKSRDIPRRRKYQEGGLGKKMDLGFVQDDEVVWSPTSSDDEHTGCSPKTRTSLDNIVKHKWLESTLLDILDNDVRHAGEGSSAPNNSAFELDDVEIIPGTSETPRLIARISELEGELAKKTREVIEFQQQVEALQQMVRDRDQQILIMQEKHR